ncbi:MAG: hypothetical protein N2053_07950 [Chitinispirillaceae bacterium]|nr:hypothetical protein [Chitinispirillaceae bacterium]
MPTYEYKCQKCGLVFEVFQSMKDEPLKKCKNEKCKGEVTRLISAGAGLLFKGNGFYITDYRSDKYKKAAQSDSGSKTSTASTDNSKTQSSSSNNKSKSSNNSSSS